GGNPLYRGGGSIGIIGAARAGLLLAADPDDPAARVLVATKMNLAPMPPALRLRLAVDAGANYPRGHLAGESDPPPASLLAIPEDPEARDAAEDARGALDEAADFLRSILADGPLPTVEVKRQARAAGVAEVTLRRAKRAVGVKAVKVTTPDGDQQW